MGMKELKITEKMGQFKDTNIRAYGPCDDDDPDNIEDQLREFQDDGFSKSDFFHDLKKASKKIKPDKE